MKSANPVLVVMVFPKLFNCQYIINNTEKHVKSYDGIRDFLFQLIPSQTYKINELLSLKKEFIILVEEKEVKELQFDFEKEEKLYKENQKKKFYENAMRTVNYLNVKKDKTSQGDDYIKKLSNFNF